ncbi:MAG TPA: hypothetical protein DDZ40_13935 [Deltaproteobacteria bacterium]|nr:hypothetical protein [Deltaproteobacteria bacterium]
MKPIDLVIVSLYLTAMVLIGFRVRKRATKKLDAYYLAERAVPWWMVGLSGCSSYVDIGGTMLIIGVMYYVGIKSVFVFHVVWGFFTMAIFMAYQAKYIRRSGVMTLAEWNATRFGDNRDTERLRIAIASFILLQMILTLMYVAVGTGKFAEEFIAIPRWAATSLVFVVVGVYVTVGGFFSVVWTDMFQTILIIIGAIGLSLAALQLPDGLAALAAGNPGWDVLTPAWNLWSSYLGQAPAGYHQYYYFGPLVSASIVWVLFRLMAGPLGWDFTFFLTAKNPRSASLAAGAWTLGHGVRWLIAGSFLCFGVHFLGSSGSFDAEKIMPLVVRNLPVVVSGLFMAILLAALMSTLSAIINVTSGVILNDFLKRYGAKNLPEKSLIRLGMLASGAVMVTGCVLSFMFEQIVSAWDFLLYVMLAMIMVPAALRWHWWRFGARAYLWSMLASTAIVAAQKIWLAGLAQHETILFLMGASLAATIIISFLTKPADREILVSFYAKVRPFGLWGPIRREAARRGLVPRKDPMPAWDVINAFIACFFQFGLGVAAFYMFLKNWRQVCVWLILTAAAAAVLYFTWYKNLPSPNES